LKYWCERIGFSALVVGIGRSMVALVPGVLVNGLEGLQQAGPSGHQSFEIGAAQTIGRLGVLKTGSSRT